MKFILNENTTRFILNEKFILNEEDVLLFEDGAYTDNALKVATALNTDFDNLITKIDDLATKVQTEELANKLKALQDAAEDVNVVLKTPGTTADEKQDKYKEYLNTLNTFYTDVVEKALNGDEELPEGFERDARLFKNSLNKFSATVLKTPFEEGPADENFKNLSTAVDTIKAKITTEAKDEDVQNLNTTSEEIKNKVTKIKPVLPLKAAAVPTDDVEVKEFVNSGKTVYDDIHAILNNTETVIAGKALVDLQGQYDKLSSDLDTFENCKVMQQLFADKASKAAEKASKKAERDAEKAEEREKKALGGTDWAKLYSQCTDKPQFDSFWKKYFEEEWGDKATAVKDFGKTFTDDLAEIGWDRITNPIIGFLKKPSINKLLGNKFDQNTYIVLHNAVARGDLSLNDFNEKNASNTFGDGNLIFNMNLYNKPVDEIDAYLKAQGQLRNRSSYLPGELATAYSKGQENRKIILSNIVLEKGKITNLMDDAVKSAIIKGNLRPLTTVKQILAKNIGASAENAREAASDKDIEECLEKITSKEYARKVLAYLYSVFSAGEFENRIRELDRITTTTLADIYDTYAPKAAEIATIRKILPLKNKTLSSAQVKLLLEGVAKKAEIMKAA